MRWTVLSNLFYLSVLVYNSNKTNKLLEVNNKFMYLLFDSYKSISLI
jgi:hypothetical protein